MSDIQYLRVQKIKNHLDQTDMVEEHKRELIDFFHAFELEEEKRRRAPLYK